MNLWNDAYDALSAIDSRDDLTVDQQIKMAEIKALLSIGQELSLIHHQGINPDFEA